MQQIENISRTSLYCQLKRQLDIQLARNPIKDQLVVQFELFGGVWNQLNWGIREKIT